MCKFGDLPFILISVYEGPPNKHEVLRSSKVYFWLCEL